MPESEISAISVTKTYGSLRALDDVSFEAIKGSITALIGPNGAGKSTLLKCILGHLKFQGTILVNGIDVLENGTDVRKQLAYIPQSPSFYDEMSVIENLKYHAKFRGVGDAEIRSALKVAGLNGLEDMMVPTISAGMKQRLLIAVALLAGPRVILMDEPLSNVDVTGQIEFRKLVRQMARKDGRTVLISTHLMTDASELADEIIMLNKGRVFAKGTVDELMKRVSQTQNLYLRVGVDASKGAASLLKDIGYPEVANLDDWVKIRCASSAKTQIVQSLLRAGVGIQDFRVEEASLDRLILELEGRR